MNKLPQLLRTLGLLATVGVLEGQTSPSTQTDPYLIPITPGINLTSILTVKDTAEPPLTGTTTNETYETVGIFDGMGAFDNGDGTFTLLVNHELSSGTGVIRDHGSNGAFVSRYIVAKDDFEVLSGSDLIQELYVWNMGNSDWELGTFSLDRLCSGDLPAVSALFNSQNGKGTQSRIYFNGQETGGGTAFAHVVTGDLAGESYELPRFGHAAFENVVGAPFEQDLSVFVLLDDSNNGEVFVYIGTKTDTGTDLDKAGLTNGTLYGIRIPDGSGFKEFEPSLGREETFELYSLGDVSSVDSAAINAISNDASLLKMGRPEDGVWDTRNGSMNSFYFVTTGGSADGTTTPARLWELDFDDLSALSADTASAGTLTGGTIRILLDEWESGARFDNLDNLTFEDGVVYIQEDTADLRLGRIWSYDVETEVLKELTLQDPRYFDESSAEFLTISDESSGMIPLDFIRDDLFITSIQAHYSDGISSTAVEGGQIVVIDLANIGNSATYETVVDSGTIWTYLDDGSDVSASFAAPSFDDGSWSSGAAPLGFGDGDETTSLERYIGGSSSNGQVTTFYFRTEFDVTNPGDIIRIDMGTDVDDGAIFYLNGDEIARVNMPTGPVGSNDLSAGGPSSNEERIFDHIFELPVDILTSGTNVLAAEVHQSSSGSSDMSMDAWLTLTRASSDTGTTPSTPANADGTAGFNESGQLEVAIGFEPSTETLWSVLERMSPDGYWVVLSGDMPESVIEVIDPTVEPTSTYTYRLRSYNVYGTSDYTAEIEVTTPAPAKDTVFSEDFGSGTLGQMTAVDVSGNTGWTTSSFLSTAPEARINGYDADDVSDDWLITPALDLEIYSDITLSFVTASNYNGPQVEVLVSMDYDPQVDTDPGLANWTDISSQATLSESGFSETPSGLIDLSSYRSPNTYIAFRYTSQDDPNAATYISKVIEVDQILVTGELDLPTVIPTESFDEDFGSWSTFSVSSNTDWEIRNTAAGGASAAYMNGFGADTVSDDWLISPNLDLSGLTEAYLSFETYQQYGGGDLQVMVSTDYAGADPSTANWTDLSDSATFGSDNNVTGEPEFSGYIDLSNHLTSTTRVAFRYTSTSTGAGGGAAWYVDNPAITSRRPAVNLDGIIVANPMETTTVRPVTFSVVPSGGSGPYTYGWEFFSGSNSLGSYTEAMPSILFDTAGSISVEVTITDANDNMVTLSESDFVTISQATVHTVPTKMGDVRVATFNAYLNRTAQGELAQDLSTSNDEQAALVAEIIQRVNPDVILLNEFDYDPNAPMAAVTNFRNNYLAVSQNGADPITFDHEFVAPTNTGLAPPEMVNGMMIDFDNNGSATGTGNDAYGFGTFEGQYGFVILSKLPINESMSRTFQEFLWKDMPNARVPNDGTEDYYSAAEWSIFRLSSKNHWDVVVEVGDKPLHILASHPTPPVFDDGDATSSSTVFDWNGRRNADEIRFWADYINPDASGYIYDDDGKTGGLEEGARFVIVGDQNADPNRLDAFGDAADQILGSPFTRGDFIPLSEGGVEFGTAANISPVNGEILTGDLTSDFGGRVDYVLPSDAGLEIEQGEVFWPLTTSDRFYLTETSPISSSDHRLVWLDLSVEETGIDQATEIFGNNGSNSGPYLVAGRMGWGFARHFPWVYLYEQNTWVYIAYGESFAAGLWVWDNNRAAWWYTSDNVFPWIYVDGTGWVNVNAG